MESVRLPSLPTSIENMTRDSLRSVISELIRVTEKRKVTEFNIKERKPRWWPSSTPWASLRTDSRDEHAKLRIPWTEELRNVVRCCYRYHGAEHMLHSGPVTTPTNKDIVTRSNMKAQLASTLEAKLPVTPLVCEDELSPLPHYFTPSGDVPETAAMSNDKDNTASVRTSARLERKREDEIQEIFICFYCEKEFRSKSSMDRHRDVCIKCPTNKSRDRHFHIGEHPTQKTEQVHVDHLPRARKVDLVERLGLVQVSRAKSMRKQQKQPRDIQIMQIDNGEGDSEETDNASPLITPTTPRTAKSLMSQLSREFSPSAPKTRRRSLFAAAAAAASANTENAEPPKPKVEEIQVKDHSDNESVHSSKGGEQARDPWNKEKRNSILTVGFSSPLGLRVRHLQQEAAERSRVHAEETIANYEEFCRTPKKSDEIRRLRDRKDLVTFRKNHRRVCPKWAHSYKFNKAERIEWYHTIRTGLNARSRPLRKLLKPCRIIIKRLKPEVIKKWTTRKPGPRTYMDLAYRAKQMQNMSPHFTMLPNVAGMSMQQRQRWQQAVMQQRAQHGVYPGGMQVSQNRAIRGAVPLPNGVFANMNNQQQQQKYGASSIAQNVVRSVVRNLQNQMNSPMNNSSRMANLPGYNAKNFNARNPNIDMNANKRSLLAKHLMTDINKGSPIVIDDDDDDDDDVTTTSSNSQPPPKRRRTDDAKPPNPPMAMLFKCHLCGEELQCSMAFASAIEKHFAVKHNVHTIQLIEHIDKNGHKVVSIVEKQAPPKAPSINNNGKTGLTPQNQKANTNASSNKNTANPPSKTHRALSENLPNTRKVSLSPKSRAKSNAPSYNKASVNPGSDSARSGISAKKSTKKTQPENDSSLDNIICID